MFVPLYVLSRMDGARVLLRVGKHSTTEPHLQPPETNSGLYYCLWPSPGSWSCSSLLLIKFSKSHHDFSLTLGCRHPLDPEGYQRTPARQIGATPFLNTVIRKQRSPIIITGSLVFILHFSKRTAWLSFLWFPQLLQKSVF